MATGIHSQMRPPGVDAVRQIAALPDAVVRNLQITQCYYELSQALARRTGRQANWCTFATWASKQAGQTIRREDLARAVAVLYESSPVIGSIVGRIQRELERLGMRRDVQSIRGDVLAVLDPRTAVKAAADAVGRGNLKVFEEIGLAFARFLAAVEDEADAEAIEDFGATFRPGEPPEGQRLLHEAFAAYVEALDTADSRARAELLFLANLLIGLHEQTRLQPEIAAAMNASLRDEECLRERLLQVLLPGWWRRVRLRLARLWKRELPLDGLLDRLIGHVRAHVRRAVTERLMTLHLPQGRILHLGRDLDAPFAPMLERPVHPRLTALLAQFDPTPHSVADSGTSDWSDLHDRMHFITDLFRCYHAWAPLFDAAFLPEQVTAIRAGRRPEGPL